MPLSENSGNIAPIPPQIEANVSAALLKQVSTWVEWMIDQYEYSPGCTAEDALKTVATQHGMRTVITKLALIHQQQRPKPRKGQARVGSREQQQTRWGPARTARPGG